MKVTMMSLSGNLEALFGLSLSYSKFGGMSFSSFIHKKKFYDMIDIAKKLAGKGHGHDKFLRMMPVYADIVAPFYWWKQMDTYKVGTVCQSESTMHTLMKFPITESCFEGGMDKDVIERLEKLRLDGDFDRLNRELPQSWLQRRVWMANYAVIHEIIRQRSGHKLPEWKQFIDACYAGLDNNYLPKREEQNEQNS